MNYEDIYRALKDGVPANEVLAKMTEQIRDAQEQIKKENAAAQAKEAQAKKDALMSEARAHAINSLLAYSEAFGAPIKEEEIPSLEQDLIRMEKLLEKMHSLQSGDLAPDGLIEGLLGLLF